MDVEEEYARLGKPGLYHIVLYILLCFNYIPVVINHLVMALYGARTSYTCSTGSSSQNGSLGSGMSLMVSSFSGGKSSEEGAGFDGLEVGWNATGSVWNGSVVDGFAEDVCLRNKTCPLWEFKVEEGETNLITEFNLVCDDAYLVNLATTIYFAGVMLGGVIFGSFSDRFGRKPFMLLTLYSHIAIGTALYFAKTYWQFVLLRFLQGIMMQGLQTCSYVMIMELFGPEYRCAVGTIFEVFWSGGIMWLALVGWMLRDWRKIQLLLTLPSLITVVYVWLVPESVRWLVAKHRLKEAAAIIKRAAKFNGVHLDSEPFSNKAQLYSDVELVVDGNEDNNEESEELEEDMNRSTKHYTVCDMFKTPGLFRRSFVLFYVWMVVAVAYYGLSLSVTSLAGNKYLNLFISGAIEMPAYIGAVFILNRFGRRRPLVVYLIIGGTLCVAAGVIPTKYNGEDIWWLPTLLALCGKFGMAGCFSVILLYTCELFPTVIRNVSIGACAFWGRVGGMLAPQIMLLGNVTARTVPVITFGLMALSGAVATLLLPDTLDTQLPDTVQQAEHLQHASSRAQAVCLVPLNKDTPSENPGSSQLNNASSGAQAECLMPRNKDNQAADGGGDGL